MSNEQNCANCRFFLNHDRDVSDLGECHRFPPQMAIEKHEYGRGYDTARPQDGGWSLVFPDDWCGEWEMIIRENLPL